MTLEYVTVTVLCHYVQLVCFFLYGCAINQCEVKHSSAEDYNEEFFQRRTGAVVDRWTMCCTLGMSRLSTSVTKVSTSQGLQTHGTEGIVGMVFSSIPFLLFLISHKRASYITDGRRCLCTAIQYILSPPHNSFQFWA